MKFFGKEQEKNVKTNEDTKKDIFKDKMLTDDELSNVAGGKVFK